MVLEIPLTSLHSKEAYMFEFSGFLMPLYYTSIIKEHMAVREKVGVFDVSHMGRIIIIGEDAPQFVNYLTANDVNRLKIGRAHYSLLLNKNGGIIDDIMVYKILESKFLLVVNASNRTKDIKWLHKHIKDFSVNIVDISDKTVMFAIQGPLADNVISNIYPDATILRRFDFMDFQYKGLKGIVSRTGYTGENGFEIIVYFDMIKDIINLWNKIKDCVMKLDGLPCGLGARDSLRLEAGYCLYGQDINENITPYEANLGWVVKMDQDSFIGKEALKTLKNNVKKLRVGIVMEDRAVPRSNYKIMSPKDKTEIGYVTSGAFSPLLKRGIGMGYIQINWSEENTSILINIRGKLKKGLIKSFPLYDISRYGFNRKIS